MSKELAALLGELMMLNARHPTFKSKICFEDGKVIYEAEPIVSQPFTVKDGEVHMEPAPVDYTAIGLDALKIDGTIFDPRKHLGDTFDECVKSWREDIASATAEKSDNLKIEVDAIKVEGALTPDDVAQAYLETIGEATSPSSDIVISIGTLNVNMG